VEISNKVKETFLFSKIEELKIKYKFETEYNVVFSRIDEVKKIEHYFIEVFKNGEIIITDDESLIKNQIL